MRHSKKLVTAFALTGLAFPGSALADINIAGQSATGGAGGAGGSATGGAGGTNNGVNVNAANGNQIVPIAVFGGRNRTDGGLADQYQSANGGSATGGAGGAGGNARNRNGGR